MKTIHLTIPEPSLFYSQEDENHFFRWLKRIRAVQRDVKGTKDGLHLVLSDPIDDASLTDLIALMKRYSLDMSCLEALRTPANEAWFEDTRPSRHKVISTRKSRT